MPTILQILAYRGGFDPSNGTKCDLQNALKPCNVRWMNVENGIPVSSMMLYVQAISFSIQFLLFTTFGSLADYGRWNRHILLIATVIGCASQIVPIALVDDDGSHWGAMMGIFIVALISYGTSLVFFAAAFPNLRYKESNNKCKMVRLLMIPAIILSDNLPVVRKARLTLPKEQAIQVVELWRNHVSAISTTFSNIGFLILSGKLLTVISYAFSW